MHGAGGSSAIWYKQIKAFNSHFNVLLLDLRGHGNSKNNHQKQPYTFHLIAQDIIELLDHINISKSHFIGISLGSIIIRKIGETNPSRVISLVMAGAIMKLNIRSQILMQIGILLNKWIPYLLLYKFFAYIIMPRKNHKKSRTLFINEAKKLQQDEFIKWFKLSAEVNKLLKDFRSINTSLPSLYIMGREDVMFLPSIKKLVTHNTTNHCLIIAENSGHVVNIDQPEFFNKKVIEHLLQLH